jgi:mannan endo-1,4-beta-mannosidase
MEQKTLARSAFIFVLATSVPCIAGETRFLILPDVVIGPVSPYVYGLNAQDPSDTGATVRRLGGNRLTGYNWVTNASNAGNDWNNSSDGWLCNGEIPYANCGEPGAIASNFVEADQKAGVDSLITIPMAGFVAADKDGPVLETETAPSKRWKLTAFRKKNPYTLRPDPKDSVVYEDEFVNFLTQKFHPAAQGGVKFYSLDNEPDLWSETHALLHPAKLTYKELMDRSEALASSILRIDPSALIFGPANYGWKGFLTLQEAPDSEDVNKEIGTFLDFYLDQMKRAEQRDRKRLLHVLDIHWYPEAQGNGKRITSKDVSPACIEARLQAPRSLWDPGYVEKSWIAKDLGQPIQLIPWLRQKIDKHYPGTKLAFTEYDYGAGDHISGGLAQADALGIMGKNGVFMSNYFGELRSYNKAALKLYRNYDDHHSAVGETAVSAASEDLTQTSIYAFTSAKEPGTLWVLAINKDQKETVKGKFKIKGKSSYKTFTSYLLDSRSSDIRPIKPELAPALDRNEFSYALPPLSATLFVCR